MRISLDDALSIFSKWGEDRLNIRIWFSSDAIEVIVPGTIIAINEATVAITGQSGTFVLDVGAFDDIDYQDPREAPEGTKIADITDSALSFKGNAGESLVAYALL